MTLHSSQLGRGGHRDDRRRRLLAEDRDVSFDPPCETVSGGGARGTQGVRGTHEVGRQRVGGRPIAHKSENYGEAEFLQTQLRLTDFVPRRVIFLVLLPLAGMAAIAGLTTLYVAAPRLFHTPSHRPILAVLGGPGSLGNWFSSLLLLMATFYAVVNYTVRRHRMDDYRGRYRVWLWAAACCFLTASDAAASLHQGLQELLVSLTGTRIVGDGSIWWLVPAGLLLGFVGARLLADVWYCRLSSAALVLAAIAYIAALAPFFHVVQQSSDVAEVTLLNGLLLAGHLLLVWSIILHARFVLLDAEGQLSRPAARRQAKSKPAARSTAQPVKAAEADSPELDPAKGDTSGGEEAETEKADDGWVTAHPRPASEYTGAGASPPVVRGMNPPSAAPAPTFANKSAVASSGSSVPVSGPDKGKLSKADRKAMKKQLLEERLKAEQRKAANW
jgi:hypothetical protein